jgi:hypothetical protein
MKLSDNFLERWEHILSDITDKTTVPIECIEKIIIKYDRRRRKTVNFSLLRRQGLELEEIELVVSRQLQELGDSVYDMEFIIDVEAVATLIQPETNKILGNL